MLQGSTAMRGLNGTLGQLTCEQAAAQGIFPPDCVNGGGSGSGSGWTTTNKILSVISDLWGGYNASQSSGGAGNGGTPQPPADNTLKYVLIGGGVLAAVGIAIYAISSSKESEK